MKPSSSTTRSKSSSKTKELKRFSNSKLNSNTIKNSSVSASSRSKNILSKYYIEPNARPSESKEPEGVADKLKERILKLEQELGDALGIEYHPEKDQKVQAYLPKFEPKALRDLRQIRQSMGTKSKK